MSAHSQHPAPAHPHHDYRRRWRSGIFKTTLLTLTSIGLMGSLVTKPLLADEDYRVRFTSINGIADANHEKEIEVNPEDIVSLTGDVLDRANDFAALDLDVEDLIWSARYKLAGQKKPMHETCDTEALTDNQDCLDVSSFEVTDYGVNFYVPKDMGATIKIFVRSRDPKYGKNFDEIILKNKLWVDRDYTPPPSQITSDADDYRANSFDYTYALSGQGRWVWINGERFWKPYVADADWVPYTNGYISWADADGDDAGVTWVGYDSFSWVTDHYGVWRYHNAYGWIWWGTPSYRYYRSTFTTFWTGEADWNARRIGWYPYHADPLFATAYSFGEEVGFIDGFIAGAAFGYAAAERDHYWGLTLCGVRDLGVVNIRNVRIVDQTIIKNVYVNSVTNNYYGGHFGGHDVNESKNYITNIHNNVHVEINHTTVNVREIKDAKGNVVRVAQPRRDAAHPVPASVTDAIHVKESAKRPIPLGSVVKAGEHPHDAPVIERPTSNHHGISNAPRFVDSDGMVQELAPHTKHPAQHNEHSAVPKPVVHPKPPVAPKPPHFDPNPNAPPHHTTIPPAHPSPIKPTHPTDPVKPTHPTDPVKPTHPTEPVKPTHPTDPVKPTHPTEPVKPTHPTDPVKPTHPTEPVKPTHPTDPVKPTHPTPIKPTHPANGEHGGHKDESDPETSN